MNHIFHFATSIPNVYFYRASGLVHPTSSYTATVQDIEDGLIDMGVGPFWITGETLSIHRNAMSFYGSILSTKLHRKQTMINAIDAGQRLKMTSFTIPIVTDKTVLVIPKPGVSERLLDQMEKPFAPFSWGMWGIVLGVILLTSLLSVWFSDQVMGASQRDNVERRTNFASGTAVRRPVRWRRDVYARLVLDSFIEKGQCDRYGWEISLVALRLPNPASATSGRCDVYEKGCSAAVLESSSGTSAPVCQQSCSFLDLVPSS